MFLYVEDADHRPVYQQLRDQVVEAIARGEIGEGTRLPTTRQLAVELGLNFHTVARAYDLLRQEGYLQVGRKVGASVHVRCGPPSAEWHAELRILLAAAYAKGLSSEEIVMACREAIEGFGRAAVPKDSLA